MSSDPDRGLEKTTEELDERLKTLDEHITEAEEKAPNATLGDAGEPQRDE